MNEPGVVGQTCPICDNVTPLLMIMRQCGHTVCVPCLHFHLKFWILKREKARIKCPRSGCPERIHENDINAALDTNEPLFDCIMPADERMYLQYKHYKHQVYYAFGGKDMIRRCPLCKSVYTEVRGCHYVLCANKRCLTRFCWECGQPVASLDHFTGGFCSFGYDDYYRGFYLVRFFLDTGFAFLVLLIPWVQGILFFSLPLSLPVVLPFSVCRSIYKTAHRRSNLLFPEEQCLLFAFLLLLPIGVLLIPFMLISSCFFFLLYILAIFIRRSPLKKIINIMECMCSCAACLGLDDWKAILQEAQDQRDMAMVEEHQAHQELSERRAAGLEDEEDGGSEEEEGGDG